MLLNTKHFGEINYDEETVITFDEGIPGFLASRFLLLAENPSDPFCWLQSVEDGELAFILMNVQKIMPDYAPQVEPEALASLGDDIVYYNIAVVPEDIQKMRVNLRAPIAINTDLRKGKQVIAENPEYGVRHYIFDDIQHKKVI